MEENKWNELKQLNDTKQLNQLTSPGIKIGIYGSSFDPITNVHLWTASTVAHRKS